MTLIARLDAYARLIRLDKPIGTLLLLWPTLWGLWFASFGPPPLAILWIFVLGTVLMRSAGCALNDFADRHFDGHVARTRHRPLATGEIRSWEALLVAAVLALLAFLLILPLNAGVLWLSVLALCLAASYPYTKRFFALPQAYLGIAFGFGIPMGFAALHDAVPWEAWVLLAANVLWSLAYDTEYAMVDRADDLKLGLRTAAITFGRYDVAAVLTCYAGMLALLAWLGRHYRLGQSYELGLAVAAAIMAYHYWLIRGREPARCFRAFRHNNWVGAAIFAGLAIDLWPTR